MRIPFFHSWAAGLSFTDDRVVWATGMRLGRRLRRLETGPSAEGDLSEALASLVGRLKPAHPYVVTHLDPLHIRHTVLQGPVFDDAASFDAWLEAEARRQLPPRASLSDFVLRIQRLEETEEYTRCLMALASRKAVEQRVALLEEAGLYPLRISSLDAAVGEALGLDPGVVEQSSAVLVVRSADATLLQYQEGVLQSLISLPYGIGTTDAVSLLQEVTTHLAPMPNRLYIVGTEAQQVIERARQARLLDGLIKEAPLETGAGASALPSAHVPAAALALQELFSVPEAVNFLEPDVVEARLQEIEKREATRAILALGSVVGVFFLLVTLVTVYLNGKNAATEAELAVLSDKVARIDQAHASVKQLAQDIAQAERLVVERTNVARILEGVGRVISNGLWLETTKLEEITPGAFQLTLTGVAFGKSDIAAYLDSLEQAPFARNVRLLFSQSVRAAALYKHTTLQDRALTRFEIQLDLTSLSHEVEAP